MDRSFFRQNAEELAPLLVGKLLCRKMPDGSIKKLRISETEAYCGMDDTACHAHKGKHRVAIRARFSAFTAPVCRVLLNHNTKSIPQSQSLAYERGEN